jgi:hypothetical protein
MPDVPRDGVAGLRLFYDGSQMEFRRPRTGLQSVFAASAFAIIGVVAPGLAGAARQWIISDRALLNNRYAA